MIAHSPGNTMPASDHAGQGTKPPLQAKFAEVIARWTEGKEDCETPIPGLAFFRRDTLTEPRACLVEPSIVLVAQGAKQLLIGDNAYAYDTERFLIASLDLPASSQVLEASPDVPCLGLMLRLDLRVIAQLISQIRLLPACNRATEGADALRVITPELLA